ncbi:MAG: 4-alpha-glucanotransferase [Pseudomonas citronellolis]|nr:MAG: 4-alpha-glucanotransferase [Pseudomonas citronellolis]
MNEDVLARLASAADLRVDWIDANGRPQKVAAPALQHLLGVLGIHAGSDSEVHDSLARLDAEARALPALLTVDTGHGLALHGHFAAHSPWRLVHEDGSMAEGHLDEHGNLPGQERCGYHRLWVGDQELALLVAPPTCPSVQQLCGRPRIWGLTAQLYSLRRDGDGGLGDSAALEDLLGAAARLGADAVGISPIHAMTAAERRIYSPYSPSSRLFFNELHAAPSTILGQATVQQVIERHGLGPRLQQLEALQLVDWPAAAQLREHLLRQLYLDFLQRPTPLHQDFAEFRANGGDALLQHCCFRPCKAAVWPLATGSTGAAGQASIAARIRPKCSASSPKRPPKSASMPSANGSASIACNMPSASPATPAWASV